MTRKEIVIKAGICSFLLLVVVLIAIPNFFEACVRGKVSRAKADMRSLATGLEAYYVDNGAYPAWVCGGNGVCSNNWITTEGLGSANGFAGKKAAAAKIHTFRVLTGDRHQDPNNQFFSLTTPISYVTCFFTDPFAATKGASYGYYAQKTGWIVYSFGDDCDENAKFAGDLDPYIEAPLLPQLREKYGDSVYDYHIAQPTLLLITSSGKEATGLDFDGGCFTYDPTNGSESEGDIYRCKQ
ncbi:MAG: hypothetical protein NTX50_04180 [Candidatus Sumerlaeota bacterium]|nr:hypothetical protein [Candidatus Sumerlaeota bacterium]